METRTGPYDFLHIYLFDGRVTEVDERGLGDAFIGNWVEEGNSFLFFSRPAEKEVGRLLEIHLGLKLVESHCFSYEQWQGSGFSAFRVGDLFVSPPWGGEKVAGREGRILLDPGVVFGNGLHPTTRDCLRAVQYAWRLREVKAVLDLGTGSGILALAASVLGAETVLAVDVNPLCVKTAIRNAALNGLADVIQVVQGRAEDFAAEPADLTIANIHYEVIGRLLDMEGFRESGAVILSGLLRSQFRDVRMRLENKDFRVIREWDQDMTWFTLLAERGKQ